MYVSVKWNLFKNGGCLMKTGECWNQKVCQKTQVSLGTHGGYHYDFVVIRCKSFEVRERHWTFCKPELTKEADKGENSVWAKAFAENKQRWEQCMSYGLPRKQTKVRTVCELKLSQETNKGENSVWAKAFPENKGENNVWAKAFP